MKAASYNGPGRPLRHAPLTAPHHTSPGIKAALYKQQLSRSTCVCCKALKDPANGAASITETLERPTPPTKEPSPAQQAQQAQQQTISAGTADPSQTKLQSLLSQPAQKQWQVQAPRTIMYYLRLLRWRNLRPQDLGISMLFVLGVILVNYGVESMLDYYLGTDNPLGSCLCIFFGAGVLIMMRLKRIPVSNVLLAGFWS